MFNQKEKIIDAFGKGVEQGWVSALRFVISSCTNMTPALRDEIQSVLDKSNSVTSDFDRWLANEELKNGCMGLSVLERDQMRTAFNAGRSQQTCNSEKMNGRCRNS